MTHRVFGRRGVAAAVIVAGAGLVMIAAGVAGLALSRGGAAPEPAATRVPAPAGPAAAIPWPGTSDRVAPPVPADHSRDRRAQPG